MLVFYETFDPRDNGSKVGIVFVQRFDGSNGGFLSHETKSKGEVAC